VAITKASRDFSTPTYSIRAQGDRCLSVDFGDDISVATGRICLSAAELFRRAKLNGVLDITPSFNSVALLYSPAVSDSAPDHDAFDILSNEIDRLLKGGLPDFDAAFRLVEIPVCYNEKFGPDLDFVAQATGLKKSEIITRHSQAEVMVFMLGFAPGLPYIGVHDPIFAIPRRAVPRTTVPAGSVAIANRQSTIYPNLLPGGWHIIGATPLKMFDVAQSPPSVLLPGDQVRFVPISLSEFQERAHSQMQGSKSVPESITGDS
jgi:inhibitor of KinA